MFVISTFSKDTGWEKSQALKRIFHFKRITTDHGLSNNIVRGIVQDARGFIWIATAGGGLNRFDGKSFVVYKNDPADSTTILSNSVLTIHQDKGGLLWLGTASGLSVFNPTSEKFYNFKFIEGDSTNIGDNQLWCIHEDRSGTVWIGSVRGGLTKVIRPASDSPGLVDVVERLSFKQYRHDPRNPNSPSNQFVWSICEDSEGLLWLGTGGGGLDRFDPMTERFTHFKHDPNDPSSISANAINTLYQDRFGSLWVGMDGVFDRLDKNSMEFTHYPYDSLRSFNAVGSPIWSFCEDSSGNFWIGADDGLTLMDRTTGKLMRLQHDKENPFTLTSNFAYRLFVDRFGLLWVGTYSGISILVPRTMQFRHYVTEQDPAKKQGVGRNHEDATGTLWFAAGSGGLRRIDGITGHVTKYTHDPGNPNSLNHDEVTSICESRNGVMWIGTGDGLNRLNRSNGRFTAFRDEKIAEGGGWIQSICEDRFGAVWLGTVSLAALTRFDPGSRTFAHYSYDPTDSKTISHNFVTAVYEDKTGTLWVGTQGGGVNRVVFDNDSSFERRPVEFKRYQTGQGVPNEVYAIYDDTRGNFWIGTGNGLGKYDKKSDTFRLYLRERGRISNVVTSIISDGKGDLWVAYEDDGLARFNPVAETFQTFTMHDGLQSKGLWALFRRRNNEIIVAGANGLVVFHPDSIRTSKSFPSVALTSMTILNQPARFERTMSMIEEISLSYNQNFFSLDFAALEFLAPERIEYAYMLEGLEKDWVYPIGTRDARYTAIPPGDYVFRVKATNSDGVWSDEVVSLRLMITPPWWKATWAYGIYAVAIFGVLYSLRRFEKSREGLKHQMELKHAEAEKLREIDQLKSHFFANISHEFRTPLTLILGPIHKWRAETSRKDISAKEMNNDFGVMERNAQRLLHLINQLLDLSKLEAGKMKLQAAAWNIIPFLKGIAQSFQSSAGRRGISFDIETETDEIVLYFDRDKMEKILTNLMSNAVKFTRDGGTVSVKIGETAKPLYIAVSIKDTGTGMSPDQLNRIFNRFYQVDGSHTREQEGTGIGLALTKELVELHHGTIEVKSQIGQGSEFIVRLPLGRSHLKDDEVIKATQAVELAVKPLEILDFAETAKVENHNEAEVKVQDSYGKSPLVLVVEDNADVRTYIRLYLAPEYRVLEGGDGAEGIEKAKENVPDLIISDVMMPKMDGYEVCKRLKQDERTSHIPIILLTAKAGQENRIEGLETGADDYLVKPFDARELLARVKNLIELRRKLRERFSVGQVLKPGEISVSSMDDAFLRRVKEIAEKNIGDEEFTVDDLAAEVGMSYTQIHRKLTALTGLSANRFIRYLRLHRAMDLLKQDAATVSEIGYMVGFSSPAYFTKCFREQFDILPSEVKQPS